MGEWLFGGGGGGGGGVYYGAMGLPKGGVKKVPAGGSSCCVCLCCSNKRLCSQRSVDLGPTAVVPCLKRSCCSTRGARAFLGLALLGRDGMSIVGNSKVWDVAEVAGDCVECVEYRRCSGDVIAR
jgi:hypothetical protein